MAVAVKTVALYKAVLIKKKMLKVFILVEIEKIM